MKSQHNFDLGYQNFARSRRFSHKFVIWLLFSYDFHCVCSFVLIFLDCPFDCLVGKAMMPKTENEVKLMSFGKILENKKTVGQCKLPLVDIGGGIIMMRVVGQPAMEKAKTGNVSVRNLISDFV